MNNCLILANDGSVMLQGIAVKRLLEKDDGDAALLYLAVLRHQGAVLPRDLTKELRWERSRVDQAEKVLQELNLVSIPADEPEEPKIPKYQRSDVIQYLTNDTSFQNLVQELEKKIGSKLNEQDLEQLLELYDHLELPADVIYLLTCHCMDKVSSRYGRGRRAWIRIIVKEGYVWARKGITDQKAAVSYLKEYAALQAKFPQYMEALEQGDRKPVKQERRYLTDWIKMGFPPEAVTLAYEQTIFKCQKLQWNYLNKILLRWHDAGWHTPEEIEANDRTPRPISAGVVPEQPDADMLQYIREFQSGLSEKGE